ncbi:MULTISPECIES: histidine--tRNA ligase [Thermodesulfovibrio]|uniref:histidine--tRNA ligase n=1 Tax=Thermodesulfovibrio TaxID=28261 RepID=UPI002626C655|nr:histidine--tRNA ligase [Thermodesulfovibrio sp.]
MKYSALRGMKDILPDEINIWQHIEEKAREIFEIFNFREIRTPILEQAELFLRSIGEDTDIVEKEMYVFHDKKGRKVALRPEGTASVVRAYIQNSLFNAPSPQKFYYIGPMFRYERPQKGRFRQFHQIGVESFGVSSPEVEAELLFLLKKFFESLKIVELSYEINSIGCKICRPLYKEGLYKFLGERVSNLCFDCQRRFETNPLRVIDCKVPSCRETLSDIPLMINFLCENCREHFSDFQKKLELYEIPYKVNPKIVRGLDYYTGTVFEVTTNALGAQNAVAAGGRYDELVELFGGPSTPAAGFAIGIERLVELLDKKLFLQLQKPLIFVAHAGEALEREVLNLSSRLRDNSFIVERAYENLSLKAQLKRADRLKAKWVIIVGEEEIKKSLYKWKKMSDGTQGEATLDEIISIMKEQE